MSKTKGAVLTEYSVLLAVISVVAIGSVVYLGLKTNEVYSVASDSIAASHGEAGGGEVTPPAVELPPPPPPPPPPPDPTEVSGINWPDLPSGVQCFSSANTNKVGQSPAGLEYNNCKGRLIVSTAKLQGGSSGLAVGDKTFSVLGPDGVRYSFFNGDKTIFTGQVNNFKSIFFMATTPVGDVSHWDTSNGTDMSLMFYSRKEFNSDISRWNVSKVTNFQEMFGHNEVFNADISNWDMRSAQNLSYMFYNAKTFNQPLDKWKLGINVKTVLTMFTGAAGFDQKMPSWCLKSGIPGIAELAKYDIGVKPSC